MPPFTTGRLARALPYLLAVALLLTTAPPADAGDTPPSAESPDLTANAVGSDVVVYGATPGGIAAAVAAARAGARVILVEPRTHVGGMMTNGLSWTDVGDPGVIGGMAREFFDRAHEMEGGVGNRWVFAPSTADAVFEDMLAESGVRVLLGQRLPATGGVAKVGGRIASVQFTSGLVVTGDVFIDGTYEGDLLARAGATFHLGRESRGQYREYRAGVRPGRFVMPVPPGRDPGFPSNPPGAVGTADARIQGSNYRLCVTDDPANRVPFTAPAGYDADRFAIIEDFIAYRIGIGQVPRLEWFMHLDAIGAGKFDLNETGSISFGLPGANWNYPTSGYSARSDIELEHRVYQKGLLYFLSRDPAVPVEIRQELAKYGLCADEFTDNGNWPRMLYLREGRRLVGEHVLTQHDVEALISKPDTIGLASYRLDAHNVSRWIANGELFAEGNLGASPISRWSIPYESLVPRRAEVLNLLVPVAASASHVAHASLRMEPQYLIMGHAAGRAAAMAASTGAAVQDIDVRTLQARLRTDGAILDDPGDFAKSFYDAIVWAYHEGITAGCAPGRFCPNDPLRRDQMAALLARALELPPATSDHFVDDGWSTHEADINRVAEAGIALGCASDRYCGDRIVSREQMASFLVRAFRLPQTDQDLFTDDEGSSHENAINRLAVSGLASGCAPGQFCPRNPVTRGQTLAFLFRHYDGGPSGGWTPEEPAVDGEPTDPGPTPTPLPSPSPTPTPTPSDAPESPSPSLVPSPSPSPVPTAAPTDEPSPSATDGSPSPGESASTPSPATPSASPQAP